ncbi:MAG: N-acetylmuramoyl-L-alanine amidase [Bacteroidales bacterium]|nr:N-acetylmuramoyl-L-alanine amidase [Bacteroidales bacterium]
MKKALLIFDPPHGIDTPGKRSPDGRLEEWKWGRDRIRILLSVFQDARKGFDVVAPFIGYDTEPGLRTRVDHYNILTSQYELTYMISLHVDAYRRDGKWSDPKGTTIFTSRGETRADLLATELGEAMKHIQPEDPFRFDFGLSRGETIVDLDREANFTVIFGYRIDSKKPWSEENFVPVKYDGVLIENGFMTNKEDIEKLLRDQWNRERENGIILGIMNFFHTLGLAPKTI